MRDVYVAGIGITTFTRLEYPLTEIAAYASMMALRDAGVTEVDQIYVANMGAARVNHQTALASAVADSLSLLPAGAAAIENGPASGAAAIKAGFQAVASGMDDVVLVAGAERMREVNNLEATDFVATLTHPHHRVHLRSDPAGACRHVHPALHGEVRSHRTAPRHGGREEPERSAQQRVGSSPAGDHARGHPRFA